MLTFLRKLMLFSDLNDETNAPEAILLVGLPGTGKSTWSKKFIIDNNYFTIISVDNIIEEYAEADGIKYNDAWGKYISMATKDMNKNLQHAYKNDISVIIDKTNLTIKSRNRVLSGTPSSYVKTAVVFLLSDTELASRLEIRKNETGKSISDNVLKTFKTNFIFPTLSEGFLEIITVND